MTQTPDIVIDVEGLSKSFGGREVAYPGTWDLPVNKLRYGAYQLARKMRDKLR